MPEVYLMQRFCMNRGFPSRTDRDIGPGLEPYIYSSFVLFDESGNMIPMARGLGDVDAIDERVTQGLRALQDGGFQIRGEVHPMLKRPKDIQGDIELYQDFPAGREAHFVLTAHGVKIAYSSAA